MAPPAGPAPSSVSLLAQSVSLALPDLIHSLGPSDSTGLGLSRAGCVGSLLPSGRGERGCNAITPTPTGGKRNFGDCEHKFVHVSS